MRPTDHEHTLQQPTRHVADQVQQVNEWLHGLKNKSASRHSKKKAKASDIQWLFDRFSVIWGAKWDKQYNEKTELLAEQWREALADLNMPTMKEGLSKARLSLQWPPTIAEFIQLCRGVEVVTDIFTYEKARDMADKKISRFTAKNFDEAEMIRSVFKDLMAKIYTTKSELCDFAICSVDKCYHYTILDSARLSPWLCVKHEGN